MCDTYQTCLWSWGDFAVEQSRKLTERRQPAHRSNRQSDLTGDAKGHLQVCP